MTNIDLTPIIQAIIALIAALVTYKLIPWIKARTTAAQQANMRALIKTLVFAAEQIYGAGEGTNKLQYVCKQLGERGYKIDLPEIEAAVGEYLNPTGIAYVTGDILSGKTPDTEPEPDTADDLK